MYTQNCAEMERYLVNEQLTPSSERKSSRSWTSFLSGAERRPSSLPLKPAAAASAQSSAVHQQILPVSFTLHRHCSTPSPTASSSPFSLASPASLGATTPDDDGTNPVDILCFLNIDGVGAEARNGGSGPGDVVSSSSSSSSSTTSWDSTRSDPDVPIPGPSTTTTTTTVNEPVQQRYARRPTELRLTPAGADQHMPASPSPGLGAVVSPQNAACLRRVAKRHWRDVAASSVMRPPLSYVVRQPVSPSQARTHEPQSQSVLRLPPLPSPAEMAYLRSLSGGVGTRTIDPDRGPVDSVVTRTRSAQRSATMSDRSCPPPPSTVPENAHLSALETSTAADPVAITDAKKQPRVYGCSVVECGKLYSKSSHLKAHMRSHTGRLHVLQITVLPAHPSVYPRME